LKAAWPQRSARFGAAVAVDAVVVAGAPAASGCGQGVSPPQMSGCTFSGEAYVFSRVGELEARLKSSVTGERDAFGAAVAAHGEHAFVGAPREDGCPGDAAGNICPDSGAVHVFTSSVEGWSAATRLAPSGEASGARFGSALAARDGKLVVGAPEAVDCSGEECRNAGTVHVFEARDDPGLERAEWVHTATLTDPEPIDGARFGAAVALGRAQTGGDVIVVGAPDDPRCSAEDGVGGCTQAGAAHVFVRTSTTWAHAATLRAEVPTSFELFGFAVAAADARVAVGIPNDARCGRGVDPVVTERSCATSGAAEIFAPVESRWRRTVVLKGDPSDRGDRFGSALAFGGDRLFVGAPGEASCGTDDAPRPEDDGCPHAGAVTAFAFSEGAWSLARARKPSVTRAGLQFGAALSVDGDALAVGLPGDGSCRADAPDEAACFESGRVELPPDSP
jgi:hypothetical protein